MVVQAINNLSREEQDTSPVVLAGDGAESSSRGPPLGKLTALADHKREH
jgi:hypothetical protein